MDIDKNQELQRSMLKSTYFAILLLLAAVCSLKSAKADFATPFVEINNQVGDISEAHGYVVAGSSNLENCTNFLVIVTTDTMEYVVIRATAEKGVVKESMLGRWIIIKGQVTDHREDPVTKRIEVQLKILSVKFPETNENESKNFTNEEYRRQYEKMLANEQDAQRKFDQSGRIKYNIELLSEGKLAQWIKENGLPPLKVVTTVSDFLFKTTDEDFALLSQLTEIRYISCSGTKITDKGLSYIAGLKKLEVLYTGDTKISDNGLVYLKDLTKLRELWLRGTSVTDNGMKYLKDLSKLESLEISRTSLGDVGLIYIKDLTSLKSLDISNTNASDRGILFLKNLKNLQSLNLYNTKTTQNGRDQLIKAIPGLRINTEAPPIKH